jgi:hypothetical protein
VDDFGVRIGALAIRGERGVLAIGLDAAARLTSNPFFPYLLTRIVQPLEPTRGHERAGTSRAALGQGAQRAARPAGRLSGTSNDRWRMQRAAAYGHASDRTNGPHAMTHRSFRLAALAFAGIARRLR